MRPSRRGDVNLLLLDLVESGDLLSIGRVERFGRQQGAVRAHPAPPQLTCTLTTSPQPGERQGRARVFSPFSPR